MTKEIADTLDEQAGEDFIDVRSLIQRFEELEDIRDNTQGDLHPDDAEELAKLVLILADLAGNGGDEQWRGDWYPVTLLKDSYFEEAMDELLEDCGTIPKDIPSYLTIEVDYDALKTDYTSTEIEGATYWYR